MSPDPQVRLQQWNHRDEVYLSNKIYSTDSETCVEVTVLLVGWYFKVSKLIIEIAMALDLTFSNI